MYIHCLVNYKQIIFPILDYMCILVNSSTQRKIKRLQPLQNRAIRTIEKHSGYRYISTEEMKELHSKFRLKMLSERRNIFMLKLMYTLNQELENVNTYRPEMVLRTVPKVKMKMEFTDKARVRPYYVCNRVWDKLESSIKKYMGIF